jgi:hypothetical protein
VRSLRSSGARRPAGGAAGWLAALFLGLDLPFLACALYLLTETFFTFLLVLFAVAWIEIDDVLPEASRAQALAALAGLFLSCAALTRPIAYYLVPIAAVGIALASRARGMPRSRAAGCALALLLPFVVLCGGWQLRNRLVSGSAEFSQIASVNLLRWRAPGIVALRDGIAFEAAQERLLREFELAHPDARGAARYRLYGAEGRRIIRSEPLLFARTAIAGLVRMMLAPGEYILLHVLGVDHPSGPAGDLVRLGFAQFLRTWPLGQPGAFLLFVFVLLHLAALYACAAVALWRLPHRPRAERSIALLAVALIVYFAVLSSGPEAYPRFRAPLAPFLALLAGIGAQRVWGSLQRVGAPQIIGRR